MKIRNLDRCHTSSRAKKRSRESKWIFSKEISKIIIEWCSSPCSTNLNSNSNSISHRNFRIKVISNHTNNNYNKINKLTIASKKCSPTSIHNLKFSHSCVNAELGLITTKKYSSMLTFAHKCSTRMVCSFSLLCSWSTKLDKGGLQLKPTNWEWTYWRSLDHSLLTLNSISTWARKVNANQSLTHSLDRTPSISNNNTNSSKCSLSSKWCHHNNKWNNPYNNTSLWRRKNTLDNRKTNMKNMNKKASYADTAESHLLHSRSRAAK